MPAAAQHSRLDLQRSLLDQDGQGREDTQSLTDGGEEERPALQSGLPGVGVGTGLWGSAEGPHCRAHGTRGTGCCPLPHCLPWARSPAESRQILQTCPLCPLPISLCPSPLKSLSFSQQPPQVLPQCVSVSHLHPGPICQDWSPLPPPAFLPGASREHMAGNNCKVLPAGCSRVAESLLRLAEQTAWGRLEAHTWGIAGSGVAWTHTQSALPYLGRRAAGGARWGRGWDCPPGGGGPPGGSRRPRLRGPC